MNNIQQRINQENANIDAQLSRIQEAIRNLNLVVDEAEKSIAGSRVRLNILNQEN